VTDQRVVVCVPAQTGEPSVAPCADAGGAAYVPSVVVMSTPGPVTFDHASQLFQFGFTVVLTFFIVGKITGEVLGLIRGRQ